GAEFDERIWTAHVVWEKETPEALAEYARVRHEPRTGGGSFESEGYYIQLAYRLPGAASAFKPYARVERVRTPFDEPIFGGSRLNYDARVAGVRFDFSSFVALKAEYRSERFQLAAPTRSDRLGSLFVQASLTITGGAGGGEAPTVTASGKNEPQRSSN
ncbi:MAG: hypothetical protein HY561_11670, partial [Gemmatimonadetes bacterium]|nr:hypothetical protein [Gemmatimonadota bacterium]